MRLKITLQILGTDFILAWTAQEVLFSAAVAASSHSIEMRTREACLDKADWALIKGFFALVLVWLPWEKVWLYVKRLR